MTIKLCLGVKIFSLVSTGNFESQESSFFLKEKNFLMGKEKIEINLEFYIVIFNTNW